MKTANCPACFLKLEVSDRLVECPCCDSLLRLARWKPPAFELIRLGNALETPAEKDDRIRYEAEMARITYREPGSGHTRVRVSEIDISAPARTLRVIRFMNSLMLISCGVWLVQTITLLVWIPELREGLTLTIKSVYVTILFLVVCVSYRYVGVIDERAWSNYMIVLPPLLPFLILEMLLLFLLTTGVVSSVGREIPLDAAVYYLLYIYFHGVIVGVGLVNVRRLRRMQLPNLGVSLVRLLSELRRHKVALAPRAKSARRLNAPLGVFFAAAGIVIILTCFVFPVLVKKNEFIVAILFSYPQMAGWVLLMRSRRYFQVDADSLLAVDKRRPILFLRPFSDDQKLKYLPPRNLVKMFIDFSLETRLSNHFTRFGPFVAAGVSGETVPVRGAARVILSNQEWLPRVTDWMNEASVIVMYAGMTNWVNWELAKIIETGNILKLILIIPEVAGEARAVRAENVSMRIERLSQILKDTRWSISLGELRNVEDVRAMLFGEDGSVVIIRSQSHNRDSHNLAALIAHYLMLSPPVSLNNEAEARKSMPHTIHNDEPCRNPSRAIHQANKEQVAQTVARDWKWKVSEPAGIQTWARISLVRKKQTNKSTH